MGHNDLLDYILTHEDAFKSKARLASLYSDFSPLRSSNPDGFAANLNAWKTALLHAAKAGVITTDDNTLCIKTGGDLGKALEIPGLGRPASLGVVVDDLLAKKNLIPVREFLDSTSSPYAKPGWLPHFTLPTVQEIAKWGLRQVGLSNGSNTEMVEGDLVVLSKVEEAASKVAARISDPLSSTLATQVYSLEMFTYTFSDVLSDSDNERKLSELDIHLLITHLARDKHLAQTSYNASTNQMTIKLSTSTTAPPSAITETDWALASLYTLAHKLELQTASLQSRITLLDGEVRTAISNTPPQKQLALRALRSKKLAEATLARRDEALTTVQRTITDIEDAATRVDVVRALDGAGKVLDGLNREVGGVEGVEDVLERLREGRADAEDIAAAVSEYGAEGVLDEGEVDEEIEALEREEKEKRDAEEAKALEQRLPSVPDTAPGTVEPGEEVEDADMAMQMSTVSLEDVDTTEKQAAQ